MTHFNTIRKRCLSHVKIEDFQKPIKEDVFPKVGEINCITKLSKLCQK
jgi:hypothetical protein